MSGDFRYRLRVRYAECDAQKVVFNARYGEYVDLATTEFFRALGYGEALVDGSLDYQLVRQTLEWKAPARFDDVVEIAVRCARVGTTSFVLEAAFRIAGDAALIATAGTTYVLIDEHGKTPVSDRLRTAMLAGVDGLTDHAGLPTAGRPAAPFPAKK